MTKWKSFISISLSSSPFKELLTFLFYFYYIEHFPNFQPSFKAPAEI